jgi:hypothetical protein
MFPRVSNKTIFISHASIDRSWVDKLGGALARRDWTPGIERSQVHADETDRARTVRDLEGADVLLVVLSANSIVDSEVLLELELSEKYGTPTVAARIDDAELPEELERRLTGVKAIAFHVGEPEEQIQRLHSALGRAAAQSQRVSTMELETLMPDDVDGTRSPEGPATLGMPANWDDDEPDDDEITQDIEPVSKGYGSDKAFFIGLAVVVAVITVVLIQVLR